MNDISFMTANYVARQVNFSMTEGWMQGEKANHEYFKPVDTFSERFDELLSVIRKVGFNCIDIWTGQLHWKWAEKSHIDTAKSLLSKHKLKLLSYAGGFGDNADELEKCCKTATGIGAKILGGGTPMVVSKRAELISALKKYKLKFGIENHPETAEEVLEKIGDTGGGVIGTTIDTGNYVMKKVDPVKAIEKLSAHIFHVHLKDAKWGEHGSTKHGGGDVSIKDVIKVLRNMKYAGGISMEHEPANYDPTSDCAEGMKLVKKYLSE